MGRYEWGETSESMKFEFRNHGCLSTSNNIQSQKIRIAKRMLIECAFDLQSNVN